MGDRAKKAQMGKLLSLFKLADFDGDGYVDLTEFQVIMSNPEVRMWLAAMDCDITHPETFFKMLDENGDMKVTFEELLSGIVHLRGGARSYELAKVHRGVQDVQQSLVDLETRLTMMGMAHR